MAQFAFLRRRAARPALQSRYSALPPTRPPARPAPAPQRPAARRPPFSAPPPPPPPGSARHRCGAAERPRPGPRHAAPLTCRPRRGAALLTSWPSSAGAARSPSAGPGSEAAAAAAAATPPVPAAVPGPGETPGGGATAGGAEEGRAEGRAGRVPSPPRCSGQPCRGGAVVGSRRGPLRRAGRGAARPRVPEGLVCHGAAGKLVKNAV